MALFQSTLPLILLLALAAITLLAVQMVRLRLELWANRRVIRALEQAGASMRTEAERRSATFSKKSSSRTGSSF